VVFPPGAQGTVCMSIAIELECMVDLFTVGWVCKTIQKLNKGKPSKITANLGHRPFFQMENPPPKV